MPSSRDCVFLLVPSVECLSQIVHAESDAVRLFSHVKHESAFKNRICDITNTLEAIFFHPIFSIHKCDAKCHVAAAM